MIEMIEQLTRVKIKLFRSEGMYNVENRFTSEPKFHSISSRIAAR